MVRIKLFGEEGCITQSWREQQQGKRMEVQTIDNSELWIQINTTRPGWHGLISTSTSASAAHQRRCCCELSPPSLGCAGRSGVLIFTVNWQSVRLILIGAAGIHQAVGAIAAWELSSLSDFVCFHHALTALPLSTFCAKYKSAASTKMVRLRGFFSRQTGEQKENNERHWSASNCYIAHHIPDIT